jgi:hypothetical protein
LQIDEAIISLIIISAFNEEKTLIGGTMPRISQFFGILIYMYYNDHMPPHFHAKWGEYEAIILIFLTIAAPKVLKGYLPKSQLDLVLKWTATHNKELMENWELARKGMALKQIAPLSER